MSIITRNLPWFVRDPAIAIVGQHCYTSLVENLDATDIACLKYSLSKGLGIGIVIGGSIMKVPQLILILRAQSARGLSFSSYVLETLAYAITLAYSARNDFPFSTYGENFFLTIQNVLITLLIIHHLPSPGLPKRSSSTPKLLMALGISLAVTYTLTIVPASILSLLQVATIPLSLLSKFPQIYEIQRARSTGQLSSIAIFSQVAGCLARLFTTATEVGDPIVFAGFLLALLLNLVLGAQMYAFWGREGDEKVLGRLPSKEKESLERIIVPPLSPLPSQSQSQPSQGGRRWARKVD
ncbi:mannose-P-dolichol utilization defect 1 protein [Ramaria rubella]|nr:mannose-P-dolichol utilization defect 1 protein [Ramaria rubella]